ncbi:MAG: hypothetical protein ACUVTO_02525 [Candidatus Caldatribacteriaceae bacterium]
MRLTLDLPTELLLRLWCAKLGLDPASGVRAALEIGIQEYLKTRGVFMLEAGYRPDWDVKIEPLPDYCRTPIVPN